MKAPETRLLIGGEQAAGTDAPLEVENPATEEAFATVMAPSEEQVAAAIAAARGAQRGWERTPALERADLLHEVAARLRARADELAELMTLEIGKPLVENSDEVGWTAAAFDYYAEIGRDSAGRVIPSIEATQLSLVVKEPMGVVACIVPWNYPLLLLAWKLAPALAAGNTTVCKPSELTPLSTLALAPCLDHLPAGVVNLLAGAGEVGPASSGIRTWTALPSRARCQPGRRSQPPAPSGSPASTWRWAARTRSSSARTSPTESTSPPRAEPGQRS